MTGHRTNAPPSDELRQVLKKSKRELPADAKSDALEAKSVASLIAAGKITRETSCDGKKRYRTFEYADQEIRPSLEKKYHKIYETYACPFCSGYHLATREELAA